MAGAGLAAGGPDGSGQGCAPVRQATTSASEVTGRSTWPPTRAASPALAAGSTTVEGPTASVRQSAPATGRTEPSSPSSPRNAMPSTAGAGTWPEATRSPTAMARSSPDPTLRTVGGARFTVMRCIGQVSWLDSSAARTRPLASRQAESGEPTTVKDGRPLLTWTSTVTAWPSTPSREAEGTRPSTARSSDRWADRRAVGAGLEALRGS